MQERRKAWEELNRKLPLKKTEMRTEMNAEMEGVNDDGDWDNEEADRVNGLDHSVIDGVEELHVASITLAESGLSTSSEVCIEGEIL